MQKLLFPFELTFFKSQRATQGAYHENGFEFHTSHNLSTTASKEDVPVIVMGRIDGHHSAENLRSRSGISLDFDDIPSAFNFREAILEISRHIWLMAYETHSSTLTAQRWRVLLPFVKPVSSGLIWSRSFVANNIPFEIKELGLAWDQTSLSPVQKAALSSISKLAQVVTSSNDVDRIEAKTDVALYAVEDAPIIQGAKRHLGWSPSGPSKFLSDPIASDYYGFRESGTVEGIIQMVCPLAHHHSDGGRDQRLTAHMHRETGTFNCFHAHAGQRDTQGLIPINLVMESVENDLPGVASKYFASNVVAAVLNEITAEGAVDDNAAIGWADDLSEIRALRKMYADEWDRRCRAQGETGANVAFVRFRVSDVYQLQGFADEPDTATALKLAAAVDTAVQSAEWKFTSSEAFEVRRVRALLIPIQERFDDLCALGQGQSSLEGGSRDLSHYRRVSSKEFVAVCKRALRACYGDDFKGDFQDHWDKGITVREAATRTTGEHDFISNWGCENSYKIALLVGKNIHRLPKTVGSLGGGNTAIRTHSNNWATINLHSVSDITSNLISLCGALGISCLDTYYVKNDGKNWSHQTAPAFLTTLFDPGHKFHSLFFESVVADKLLAGSALIFRDHLSGKLYYNTGPLLLNLPEATVNPMSHLDCNTLVYGLLAHRMVNNDLYDLNYMLSFLAHMFQFPNEKPQFVTTFVGEQGTGKSTLTRVLKLILGDHSVVTKKPSRAGEHFNAAEERAILVVEEELPGATEQARNASELKTIITQATREVVRKGIDAVTIPCILRTIRLTNVKDRALHVHEGIKGSIPDRRFVYFEDAPRGKTPYKLDPHYHDWCRTIANPPTSSNEGHDGIWAENGPYSCLQTLLKKFTPWFTRNSNNDWASTEQLSVSVSDVIKIPLVNEAARNQTTRAMGVSSQSLKSLSGAVAAISGRIKSPNINPEAFSAMTLEVGLSHPEKIIYSNPDMTSKDTRMDYWLSPSSVLEQIITDASKIRKSNNVQSDELTTGLLDVLRKIEIERGEDGTGLDNLTSFQDYYDWLSDNNRKFFATYGPTSHTFYLVPCLHSIREKLKD